MMEQYYYLITYKSKGKKRVYKIKKRNKSALIIQYMYFRFKAYKEFNRRRTQHRIIMVQKYVRGVIVRYI